MQFLINLILSLFGLNNEEEVERDPMWKDCEPKELLERMEMLKDKFGHIRNSDIPNTEVHWALIHRNEADNAYSMDEVISIAESMRYFQNPDGGWGKCDYIRMKMGDHGIKNTYNYTWGDRRDRSDTDFDNGCTHGHIEYLISVYNLTKDELFLESIRQGLEAIVAFQHEDGSWENANHPHITYNDEATQGPMRLLRNIMRNPGRRYDCVQDMVEELDLPRVERKGIEIILRTQISTNGVPGVWCQQHSHETLKPTWARAYEMPSYVSKESVTVVEVLQEYLKDHPERQDVSTAIWNALAWFRRHQLPEGNWARYYDLNDFRPLFCNRDGIIVYSIDELVGDRRDGYGWFSELPSRLI